MTEIIENKTFDEIQIGDVASLTRSLHSKDLETWASVTGNPNLLPAAKEEEEAALGGFGHAGGGAVWAAALFSEIIGTRLPGPGANTRSVSFDFAGAVPVGSAVMATASAISTESAQDAKWVRASLYLPCDVRVDGQLEAVFEAIERTWGKLDIALHSIAFAPREDLHGRVTDCSREGFLMAMDISCYSFIRMANLAEPLMKEGGTLFTMSYYGAEKVVENYNVMGPVKAALEASARYVSAELGPKGIRVHTISPGPIQTRAASGIDRFDELMEKAASHAPSRMLVSIEDFGVATAFLATDFAKLMTGDTVFIDGGYHVVS